MKTESYIQIPFSQILVEIEHKTNILLAKRQQQHQIFLNKKAKEFNKSRGFFDWLFDMNRFTIETVQGSFSHFDKLEELHITKPFDKKISRLNKLKNAAQLALNKNELAYINLSVEDCNLIYG